MTIYKRAKWLWYKSLPLLTVYYRKTFHEYREKIIKIRTIIGPDICPIAEKQLHCSIEWSIPNTGPDDSY